MKRNVGRPRLYTPEEAYVKIQERAKKYLVDNQEVRLYHCAKQRASRSNIEFSITIDDIVIPDICPLLKIPLTNIMSKGRIASNASIDRIDSNKGYTKDNIQVISDLANRMKQNATKEQLITFSRSILDLYKDT